MQDFLSSVTGDLSASPQHVKGDRKQGHNDIVCLSVFRSPSYLVPQAYIGSEYHFYLKK